MTRLTPHYEIELSLEERQRIEGMLRSGKTEQRLAKRAAMILMADDGLNNQQMADRIGTSRNLVQKWRKRLAVFDVPSAVPGQEPKALARLEALLDLPRSGRPPVFPPLARHTVVAVACQPDEERDVGGVSHYRVRDLARLVAGRGEIITMSPATGPRILDDLVLKPHRVRYWLTQTDPEFQQKLEEIVDLYLSPPRHSRWLCLDEKTGIQALERLYPGLPMRPGLIERREFESIRHGVVDLLAAFDGGTGNVFAQCDHHHTNREFRHCLRARRARHPMSRWHVIMDNASYHTKPEVIDWCDAQRPKITIHWLPFHGSWLNQIEIWFSILARTCLRRASVQSTRELRHLIHRFINTWNEHLAHPFEWTYTGKPLAVSPQQFDLLAA